MSDMNVLLVQPESYPKAVTIGSDLESLQAAVCGSIEVVYPFEDNVGLIMNEEGKIEGLPLNRALRDDQGELYDIIAGDFLVVGLTEDDFATMNPSRTVTQQETTASKSMPALPSPMFVTAFTTTSRHSSMMVS